MDLPDGMPHPFGQGGGRATAEAYDVPLLGHLPFDARVCAKGATLESRQPPEAMAQGSVFYDFAEIVIKTLSSSP